MIEISVLFLSEFQSEYFRSHKSNGVKNLRCFPNCDPKKHVQRGFCGSALKVKIVISRERHEQSIHPREWVLVGEFQPLGEEFRPLPAFITEAEVFRHSMDHGNPTGLGTVYYVGRKAAISETSQLNDPNYESFEIEASFESKPWQYSHESQSCYKYIKESMPYCFVLSIFTPCLIKAALGKATELQLLQRSQSTSFALKSIPRKYTVRRKSKHQQQEEEEDEEQDVLEEVVQPTTTIHSSETSTLTADSEEGNEDEVQELKFTTIPIPSSPFDPFYDLGSKRPRAFSEVPSTPKRTRQEITLSPIRPSTKQSKNRTRNDPAHYSTDSFFLITEPEPTSRKRSRFQPSVVSVPQNNTLCTSFQPSVTSLSQCCCQCHQHVPGNNWTSSLEQQEEFEPIPSTAPRWFSAVSTSDTPFPTTHSGEREEWRAMLNEEILTPLHLFPDPPLPVSYKPMNLTSSISEDPPTTFYSSSLTSSSMTSSTCEEGEGKERKSSMKETNIFDPF